jgi:Predicted nucleoside-diphosphate sugar epimerase
VNVTVFGATGIVGRALLPLLADHEVTAVSRTPQAESGTRFVVADAVSGDGVAAALEGAEVVYYLVHSLGARDFEKQDRIAAETVAREAGERRRAADRLPRRPRRRRSRRLGAPASRRETGLRLASAGVPVTTCARP